MEKEVLREIQLTQLEIVKVVDEICEKENIQYYLCAGTMLGGVRHQGFIPWDDDLDIMLPRDEYTRLMRVLKEKLPKEYWLQTYDTDLDYWQAFAKIRKKNTVYKEKGMEKIPDAKCGIWIDIFPLDYASKKGTVNLKIRRLLTKGISFSLRRREFKLKYSAFSRRYIPLLVVLEFIPKKQIKKMQEKIMKQRSNKSKKYLVNLASTYEIDKETYPIEWFEAKERIKFEDTNLNIPKEYDKYLKQLYGDYMKLPPVEKRNGHNISEISNVVLKGAIK